MINLNEVIAAVQFARSCLNWSKFCLNGMKKNGYIIRVRGSLINDCSKKATPEELGKYPAKTQKKTTHAKLHWFTFNAEMRQKRKGKLTKSHTNGTGVRATPCWFRIVLLDGPFKKRNETVIVFAHKRTPKGEVILVDLKAQK